LKGEGGGVIVEKPGGPDGLRAFREPATRARGSDMDYHQILRNLYVGTYPAGPGDIETVKRQCGVTAVLSLQTDQDLEERGLVWSRMEKAFRRLGIKALRIPMRDFDYHDQRRMLAAAVKGLAGLIAAGHTVYLHCNAGAGRSPLVAMAYLFWCADSTFLEAVRHVKNRRECSPMTELLEVARQDILRKEAFRRRVKLRAHERSTKRGEQTADCFQDWVEAERDILKQEVCR